jgi:hypothetical protein
MALSLERIHLRHQDLWRGSIQLLVISSGFLHLQMGLDDDRKRIIARIYSTLALASPSTTSKLSIKFSAE